MNKITIVKTPDSHKLQYQPSNQNQESQKRKVSDMFQSSQDDVTRDNNYSIPVVKSNNFSYDGCTTNQPDGLYIKTKNDKKKYYLVLDGCCGEIAYKAKDDNKFNENKISLAAIKSIFKNNDLDDTCWYCYMSSIEAQHKNDKYGPLLAEDLGSSVPNKKNLNVKHQTLSKNLPSSEELCDGINVPLINKDVSSIAEILKLDILNKEHAEAINKALNGNLSTLKKLRPDMKELLPSIIANATVNQLNSPQSVIIINSDSDSDDQVLGLLQKVIEQDVSNDYNLEQYQSNASNLLDGINSSECKDGLRLARYNLILNLINYIDTKCTFEERWDGYELTSPEQHKNKIHQLLENYNKKCTDENMATIIDGLLSDYQYFIETFYVELGEFICTVEKALKKNKINDYQLQILWTDINNRNLGQVKKADYTAKIKNIINTLDNEDGTENLTKYFKGIVGHENTPYDLFKLLRIIVNSFYVPY